MLLVVASPPPASAVPSFLQPAAVAAGASALASAPGEFARQPGNRIALGYYVPYDRTSWQSLQAHASQLDYVGAQWVSADLCGRISSQDDQTLVTFARSKGIIVLPSLLTSSAALNHQLLTDPPTTDRYLGEIVSYVVGEGYDGLDLDMESIAEGDRDAFSDFVARLSAMLHAQGKLLTMAIPAKTQDVRTGWAGPYDYAALGQAADLVLLMAYDYHPSSGPAGSIGPYDWMDQVAAYATSQIPPEKVLLGLAFYGYDWNVSRGGRARSLLYPQAAELARQYGADIELDPATQSATFRYTARPGDAVPPPPTAPAFQHQIKARKAPPCSLVPPTPTPRPARPTPPVARPTPTPLPPPTAEQLHEVWLEDARSVSARLDLAARYDLAGSGAWRLGQEDPGVWPFLAHFRRGR